MCYSNLKASIGLSLAAFLAGMIPKISQMEIEEITAISTDFSEMTAWMVSCTLFTIRTTKILNRIPIIPPIIVMSTDSAKNWLTISDFFAPIAFLIQISFVLSVTETSMIFMTHIHHTSSDMAAIDAKNVDMTHMILSTISKKSFCVVTLKFDLFHSLIQ